MCKILIADDNHLERDAFKIIIYNEIVFDIRGDNECGKLWS